MTTNKDRMRYGCHDYYPFGVELTVATQEEVNFGHPGDAPRLPDAMKFTGHERDFYGDLVLNNTDYVDYMHARVYDPKMGRFFSVDPDIASVDPGNPQSWNRYAYVGSNPVNATDPTGRVLEFTGTDDAINLLQQNINGDLGDAAKFAVVGGKATLTVNSSVSGS